MRVLITGGAGFLGRGILRRVAEDGLKWDVTVYSRDETKQDECRRRYPQARYVLGDVRDVDRLQTVMAGHDWVVHAGALKYIPEAEMNAGECVSVNVDGSRNVMQAARRAGIERVVGISTDKACWPVNLYGATKMMMERLYAETSQYEGDTRFTCVRYGNVVGSTGSVIPLFQRQFAQNGKVKITDPGMTRFWMGIDEAIALVEIGLSDVIGAGSVAVPYCQGMKIGDVAKAATVDSVEVEIIGQRPGEKLHENLVHHEESVRVVRQEGFLELCPPGSEAVQREAFTVASHTPHRWMSVERMRDLIADALLV